MSIRPNCGRPPPDFREPTLTSKLNLQTARFGKSADGMPPVWVYEGSDGAMEIVDGATRATRIAKHSPGNTIRVEVIGKLRQSLGQYPKDRRPDMITVDARAGLLHRLDEVRRLCPDMRLGQILATVVMLGEDTTGRSLRDMDDDELAAAVERFAKDLSQRTR